MSTPISPKLEARFQLILDYSERLLFLVLFIGFATRVWASLGHNPFNMIGLISDGLVVAFILTRRRTQVVTSRAWDWIVALVGTMLPLLARPGGEALAPVTACGLLMFAGLIISLWAKLSLRRSFGIAAANRGVVEEGPYRLVRHPMYAGYVLVHVGFLLANPLLLNFALYAVSLAAQIARIHAEEKLLAEDTAYAALMSRVKFRLLPGVF